MKSIILDTNFIIEVLKNKIDLKGELSKICNFPFKIFVLDRIKNELDNIIEKQGGKNKELAKLALSYIKNLDIIETKRDNVDEILIEMSKESIIATQDKQLKSRLKKPFIILKQKKILELIE